MTRTSERDEDDFFLDPELHAYVDGKLPPDRMAIVEARLRGDRALGQAVEDWTEARALIRRAASGADDAPVDMRTELLARELTARVRTARLRGTLSGPGLRQLVASVAIFAAGWLGNGVFIQYGAPSSAPHEVRFLQTASLTAEHLPDALSPSDARILQAVQEISASVGRAVDYPSLDEFGLTLHDAAVSDGPDGPTVRLFYDTQTGKRISVVMMPHPESVPDYPYQARVVNGQLTAYMTRSGLDYAISGEEDPVTLATLASALR